jgi:uncharacterized protein (TIGR02118 family)
MKKILSIIAALLLSVSLNAKATVNFKPGMIKVSVFYPAGDSVSFDMNYYITKHLPFVGGLLGKYLKGATVEKGLAGGATGSPATYVAMGNMYFDSVEEFQKAFGPNAPKIMADLPNFTNSKPVIQISEVKI